MALRTTTELVGGIVGVDDSISLTPFMNAANELVTEVCNYSGYSATRLQMIETWLSAHFYAMRDPGVAPVSERAGGVGANYQSQVGLGFDVTHYGQQAMRLDTHGGLAALNIKINRGAQAPGMNWLGKASSD
jgi:hypothetical protein